MDRPAFLSRPIGRREFMIGAGALGLAGLAAPLVGCGPAGSPAARATSSVAPTGRSGSTPIKHVIVDAAAGQPLGPPAPPRDGLSAIGSLMECFAF